ncbi:hypothetical protein PIB30_000998 [Stylosanthes scabra]|uniref:Uncharacterized protein n=1 Tax=Stylosanthes scabra TaxID=79078 RepID=A0ABU6T2Q3_9FABA|nr:hypothetical protein [Stylosanthes scabra]
MNPIGESPMKQVGGRTCKTLRSSSQTEFKQSSSIVEGEIVPPLILAAHARSGRDSWAGSDRAPLPADESGRLLGMLRGIGPTSSAVRICLPVLQVESARLIYTSRMFWATCEENMDLAHVLASTGVLDPLLLGRMWILPLG